MGGYWTYCQIINLIGGAEENRTPDLRIANATLSRLSYSPTRKLTDSNTASSQCANHFCVGAKDIVVILVDRRRISLIMTLVSPLEAMAGSNPTRSNILSIRRSEAARLYFRNDTTKAIAVLTINMAAII